MRRHRHIPRLVNFVSHDFAVSKLVTEYNAKIEALTQKYAQGSVLHQDPSEWIISQAYTRKGFTSG